MADPPPPERAADARLGALAGIGAYSLWGLFPLVFHQLRSVGAGEILLHRVIWSFLVVVVLLAVQRDRHAFAAVRGDRRAVARMAAAGVLIATNWLVYIWAVNADHVVEAALGYYVNPLITVAPNASATYWVRRRCSPNTTTPSATVIKGFT